MRSPINFDYLMAINLSTFEQDAKNAIKVFWSTREASMLQNEEGDRTDHGTRGAVTAGKNMDGFAEMMKNLIEQNGLLDAQIITNGNLVTLPGFFRPTKKWDLLVISNSGRLIAALEFKSQVGSFGNNFNNRTEEAIGTAHDLWTAYREGAFGEQSRPFIGWLMLLEDHTKSRSPVKDNSPNFETFPEFKDASYADRYNLLCKKLIQEQLYTEASLVLSPAEAAADGVFTGLSEMTQLKTFATAFAAHIAAEVARD